MITIDGHNLSINDVIAVARYGEEVTLSDSARGEMTQSHAWLERMLDEDLPIYGINTGFGIFADQKISIKDSNLLSRNLVLSHAVATGPALPMDVIRAAILIRANTLASGFSGVRPIVVETLLAMLNRWVTPIIPSQGSLGSSGDLAPLSHLGLVFSTDSNDREEESGWAIIGKDEKIQPITGKSAMASAGIERLVLGPKEGLAVTNGATFSAAIGALAVHDGSQLYMTAAVALAMTLEALMGVSSAFDERLHFARNHPGQAESAALVRKLTANSTLIDLQGRVQDAYSLRCAPQVHGAVLDAIHHIEKVITREINAVTDNPLIFGPSEAISGGNFHGEAIALVMDYLGIAISELAAISERRIFRLTDGKLNAGLPPMLVDKPEAAGLNSGMMMLQYTAASLVLENQTLANSDAVHSLPTSAEQEDHNANSMTAARHATQIIANAVHIITIEIYCATRALDLRLRQHPDKHMGQGVISAYNRTRNTVPYQAGDIWWGPEIDQVKALVQSGAYLSDIPS
jgi:histidine ammonia-lyase